MAVTYLVEIDWANTGVWTDITTYCQLFSINRGRQRPIDPVSPGKLALTVDNELGRFAPGLASGPNYPNVKVNRQIRVSVTSGGTTSYLITARVDSYTPFFDGGRKPNVSIAATDGFKGLARRTFRGMYVEYVTGPAHCYAYYPLTESGTSFGNMSPYAAWPAAQATPTKYGPGTFTAGGTAGWMNGAPANGYVTTAPGTSQQFTVVEFAGQDVSGVGPVPPAVGPWSWACWFNVAAPTADYQTLLVAAGPLVADPSTPKARARAILSLDSAGKANFGMRGIAPGSGGVVVSVGNYADGKWHRATASVGADNVTLTLMVDGTTATVTSNAVIDFGTATVFEAAGFLTPYGDATWPLAGSIASVELSTVAISTAIHQAAWMFGRDGYYLGNATSDLFNDIAQLFGYTATLQPPRPQVVLDSGVTRHVATLDLSGGTYLSALQQYVDAEQGVMYISGDNVLRFRNRAYRVNQASAFTLDASRQDISINFQTQLDDSGLFNDYVAIRPGGAAIRVRDTTTTSIADNGVYTNAADVSGADLVPYTTDNEVMDYASFKVAQNSVPQLRTPTVTVDLLRAPDLWPTVQAVEIGTRFAISNLPIEAGAASLDVIVESINWTVDIPSDTVTLTMDTSPADVRAYLTLDDPVYGLLDSNSLFY